MLPGGPAVRRGVLVTLVLTLATGWGRGRGCSWSAAAGRVHALLQRLTRAAGWEFGDRVAAAVGAAA